MNAISKLRELRIKAESSVQVSRYSVASTLGEIIEELSQSQNNDRLTLLDQFAMAAPGIREDCSVDQAAMVLGISRGEYLADQERHFNEADAMLRYQWAESMMKVRNCFPSNYKNE